jgi:hypothetical protein
VGWPLTSAFPPHLSFPKSGPSRSAPDLPTVTTQEAVNGSTWLHSYDDVSRLSSASVLGVNSSWQYDLTGNRTQQISGGVTTSYTVNAADRLTAVNGTAVLTDANGVISRNYDL